MTVQRAGLEAEEAVRFARSRVLLVSSEAAPLAGILYADRLSTVSATHAREVCGAQHGFDLEGLLQARATDLYGIMTGIDDTVWDPARDAYLGHRYSYADRGDKAACKAQLQRELGLADDPERR